MKYRDVKIRVNPENSAAVQEKLFEDGCKWCDGIRYVQQESSGYLYVNDLGYINHGIAESYFKLHGSEEVTAQQILDLYHDIKTAWANGEALQFKAFDEWIDWIAKDELSLSVSDEWRIKPQTKTINQWERKYVLDGIVSTMVLADKDSNVFFVDSWLGEPYQAEYEVPND